jgi:hypothetical protein
MERGFVEKIVSVASDGGATSGGEDAPPHSVVVSNGLTLKFDPRSFTYR